MILGSKYADLVSKANINEVTAVIVKVAFSSRAMIWAPRQGKGQFSRGILPGL